MSTDWRQWCRLCGRKSRAEIEIFISDQELEVNNVNIPEVVKRYFAISISPTDVIPTAICRQCMDFLIKLIQYAERCARVDRMFTEISYENIKIEGCDVDTFRFNYGIQEEDPLENLECKNETNEYENLNSIEDHSENYEEISIDVHEQQQKEQRKRHSETVDLILPDNDEEECDVTEAKVRRVQRKTLMKSPDKRISKRGNKESETFVKEEIPSSPGSSSDNDTDKEYTLDGEQNEESEDSEDDNEEDMEITVKLEYEEEEESVGDRKSGRTESNKSGSNGKYNKRTWDCPIPSCRKIYTSKRSLQRHKRSHSPTILNTHECRLCDKKFSKIINLQNHVREQHNGEKPFMCEECGKSFATNGALKEHKIVHSQETPYECSKCSKKFKNLARLKTHEDIHNDTTYVCSECGVQLNTRRTLRNHMLIHSNQKNYKCKFCGNEYKRSKALKNHLILHSGLRPYACNFCDRTFANGSNCRSHKKKAHPQELAALEAKGASTSPTILPRLEQLKSVSTEVRKVVSKNLNRSKSKNLLSTTFENFAQFGNSCLPQDPGLENQRIQQGGNTEHSIPEHGSMNELQNHKLPENFHSQISQQSGSQESVNNVPQSPSLIPHHQVKLEDSIYPHNSIGNYGIPLFNNNQINSRLVT